MSSRSIIADTGPKHRTASAYNFHTGDLKTYGASGHNQAVAFGQPILVLDMFEHAYALDYGAAHAKYIDAFFGNIYADALDDRLGRARRAAKLFG